MAACKDASCSLPDLSDVETEEVVLELLSQGSFRCRPCSNCQNSDPFQLELTQKDFEQQQQQQQQQQPAGPSRCLVCKKCQKPYNMDEEDEDDDDDDDGRLGHLDGSNVNDDDARSSFSGTECRICQNKEKDLFSVTHRENEKIVECLVCGYRDTPSDDKNSDFSEWIECSKCPNRTLDLFVVTLRDDGSGRIHKVTCMSCGHGNTLHDPGHYSRRRVDTGSVQPYQQPKSWRGSFLNALVTACSAVVSSAQKSIQSAADQGALQRASRGHLQSRRPLPQSLRQAGVRLLGKLGEEMVVYLGNRFLRNVVSSEVTRGVAVNFGQFIGNLAAVKLQETQKAKQNDQRQQQQQQQ